MTKSGCGILFKKLETLGADVMCFTVAWSTMDGEKEFYVNNISLCFSSLIGKAL